MKEAEHIFLGNAGEDAAIRLLERKGFRIVSRNWRPTGKRAGVELDVVARHQGYLIFVEVKTRTRARYGGLHVPAHTAFTPQKKARLMRAAQMYLAEHALWNISCRFDLICIERDPGGQPGGDADLTLEHHTNVIELGQTLDSRHAPWQPW